MLRRFCGDQRGNMAILFAVGFSASAVVSAIAVDGASLYNERRALQRGVDLAALAAASTPADARAIAQHSLVAAGLLEQGATAGLTVTTGRYNPDPAIAPASRFVAGATPANAVSVALEQPGTLYFARSWSDPPMVGATALATVTPEVAFSIGSRLASLNGGIVNGVLNGLLGSSISLTALDYNGLVNAKVDLFGFLDALANELNLKVGTYDDLLKASADHRQLARALATVLNGTERAAARTLGNALGHNGRVPLNKLLQLGRLGALDIGSAGREGLFATVSALDILSASAGISDGKHQLALKLDLGVPGVAAVTTDLAVGEPPQGGTWYAIGGVGAPVRTAQVRLRLVTSVLGNAGVNNAPVRVPIYLEVAHAEAIVGAATCPTSANPKGTATLLVRPGALQLALGEVSTSSFGAFNTKPTIGFAALVELNVLLGLKVQVLGRALIEIAQTMPISTAFSSTEIANATLKTVKTKTIITSLVGSLFDNLELDVDLLGIGLSLNALTSLLSGILKPLAAPLDLVILRLTEALGVGVGEADVRVYGVRCSNPVLVG